MRLRPCVTAFVGLACLVAATASAGAGTVVAAQKYGATGDGKTDDWWAIQQGIDYLSANGGGTLTLPRTPSNTYVIRQALRMRSNVIVNVPQNSTTIKCKAWYDTKGKATDPTGLDAAYVSQWGFNGCLTFGSVLNPQNEQALTSVAVNPQAQQGAWVTLVNSGAIANFKVGDLVIAASSTSFTAGTEPVPTWGEMDRVEEIDTNYGRVRLRYSTSKGMTIGSLKLLSQRNKFWQRPPSDTSTNRSIGVPIWASWKAGIVGGTWIGKTDNGSSTPFAIGGGGLDCIVKPYAVTAGWGVGYGNLYERCQMTVDHETLSVSPVELAYLSSDNAVAIGSIGMVKGDKPFSWIVTLDEGAHNNRVAIDALDITDTGIKDVVSIAAAQNNGVTIGSITGTPISGSVVDIFAFGYSGPYPTTQGNTVTVTNSVVTSAGAAVNYGGFSVQNNMVQDSTFSTAGKGLVTGLNGSLNNALSNVTMH